jgi:hypothetical protein
MPSERVLRISHSVIFTLTLIASIIALAISASLVAHYNSDGYPIYHTGAYTARIRILLVASIAATFTASMYSFSRSFLGCLAVVLGS